MRWAQVEPKRLLGTSVRHWAQILKHQHQLFAKLPRTSVPFRPIASEETVQILQSIRGCDAGVRRYLAGNMPLVRELAQRNTRSRTS